MQYSSIRDQIDTLAQRWSRERSQRQGRTHLLPEDIQALRDAGFPSIAVPTSFGGAFVEISQSVRPICGILRSLARGDSSQALVCSMHAAVLAHWLAFPSVPGEYAADWQAQRLLLFRAAQDGAFFGTITSEPGSGGDIALTRATARRSGSGYILEGQKHFGSGLGITSFMLTTAIPEGDPEPDWFLLDVRDVPWDGSRGMKIAAGWDGHGMTATQSHAVTFFDFPAMRVAWPGHRKQLTAATVPFIGCFFASVIAGVVDAAMEIAQAQCSGRKVTMRPFESVEWARAQIDAWLITQALEGVLRACEHTDVQEKEVLQGKIAISELAEGCLQRICRVLGGGSYSRRSPIGHLLDDVRALGFLRPPWGLAHDILIAAS